MSRYPLWKYILVILVMAYSVIYTLPNFYDTYPSINITNYENRQISTDEITNIVSNNSFSYMGTNGNSIYFKSIDDQLNAYNILSSNKKFIYTLSNYNQIPSWLKINAETGEIEATPPQGLDNIKLQIIAEDEDGTLRTLEVDLDLSSNDQSKLPSKTVIDTELEKFASLQEQIHVKYNDYENYGDKIVKITS